MLTIYNKQKHSDRNNLKKIKTTTLTQMLKQTKQSQIIIHTHTKIKLKTKNKQEIV